VYCPDGCELVVIPEAVSWETLQALVRKGMANGLNGRVKLAAGFYELMASGVRLEQCARVPLLALNRVTVTGPYALAKSVMDVVGALLLLVPGLPTMAVLWCASAWNGINPLVRQRVMGQMGRQFTLTSFDVRTMAEDGGPFLRWLASQRGVRRLPALFSVLRRDLSLVGPEPHLLANAEMVEPSLPNLLTLRPGLWSLHVGIESLQERVSQDLYYVRNFSLGLDAQVIARRIADVLHPKLPPSRPTVRARETLEPVIEVVTPS
jgi:lipopolysaccharide/colanic/teichoic acid biosynthesis glycosyltransferase